MDAANRIDRLKSAMHALGVTRLADQTGLDRLVVPCMAAIRPNARTVTTHQGKGETAEIAALSALMEAAEYALAEDVPAAAITASANDLAANRQRYLTPTPLLPRSEKFDPAGEIGWMPGIDLVSGAAIVVPRDMVALIEPSDFPDISQNTNGLAAGFERTSAQRHGLCELIERDAYVIWGFKAPERAARTELDPAEFDDAALTALCEAARRQDIETRLFDITSDIAVPAIHALMIDHRSELRMAVTGGAACHPVAAMAARKAVLEAAQTRVSLVSGSRDDIAPSEYERGFSHPPAIPPFATFAPPPAGLPPTTTEAEQLRFVLQRLMGAGLREIVTVPVGGAELGIHVEKLFVPGLEDRLTNRHWRPGPRAVRMMLQQ